MLHDPDREVVRECLRGVDTVLHAATLYKPHVGSHEQQAFVDTNITGTLILLEEAVAAGVASFVFTRYRRHLRARDSQSWPARHRLVRSCVTT